MGGEDEFIKRLRGVHMKDMRVSSFTSQEELKSSVESAPQTHFCETLCLMI